MNEHKFMSNLRMSFLDHNIFAVTLIDGSDFATRPFDMVASINSKFVAIEGKFQKNFNAFGIKQIRESQVMSLDAVLQGGGAAFIFLNIHIPNKENRVLTWEWEEFKRITSTGSIKMKTLQELPFIQGKKKRFPIENILTALNTPPKR